MDYTSLTRLEFRRRFFKLFGAEIHVTDPATEAEVGFIAMKAWTLREDVRLYSDRSKNNELLRIGARNVIDFGATYDVFDSPTDTLLFSMRRKGLKSAFVRDHWIILDKTGEQIGDIIETSGILALARRWVELLPFGFIVGLPLMFIPQTYNITTGSAGDVRVVGTIMQRKNPIIVKMALDMTNATDEIDAKICVAGVSLMSVVDAGKD